MSRYRMFIAAAAAGLVASAIATSATAVVLPTEKGVITNTMLPLKGATGSGTASVQVDPYAHKVCYSVEATGLTGTLSGAIVKGSSPVVALKNARNGDLQGCVDIAQDVAQQIVANPGDYQLSVNNGALATALSPVSNFN